MATHVEENLKPLEYNLTVSGSSLAISYLDSNGTLQSLSAADTVEDRIEIGASVEIRVHDAPDATGGYDKAQVTEGTKSWRHNGKSPGYCYETMNVPSSTSDPPNTMSISISTLSLTTTQTQIIVTKRKIF